MLIENHTKDPFAGTVRVRVCGILIEAGQTLLLKHEGMGRSGHLWAPPGGGVDFGMSMQDTLKKEFKEETHLDIQIEKYLFTNEFIGPFHHAIEHFFHVIRIAGKPRLGIDPELPHNQQMLTELRFFDKEALNMLPEETIHNAFLTADAREKIIDLRGLITFKY